MSDHSKDHLVNIVTNQRGYSWLLKVFNAWSVFCMHIHEQYINVLWMFWFLSFSDFTLLIVLTLFPQHIFQFTSHTVSLTWEEAYAVRPDICQNVFIDIEKTMIKMYSWDDIAWFIIFLILYVYFISQDHDVGWLSGVFYQKPESLRCQYEIPITLTNLTFLFAVGLYFSPEVCLVMFSLYCYVWRSKLFLGTQPA